MKALKWYGEVKRSSCNGFLLLMDEVGKGGEYWYI